MLLFNHNFCAFNYRLMLYLLFFGLITVWECYIVHSFFVWILNSMALCGVVYDTIFYDSIFSFFTLFFVSCMCLLISHFIALLSRLLLFYFIRYISLCFIYAVFMYICFFYFILFSWARQTRLLLSHYCFGGMLTNINIFGSFISMRKV